LATQLQKREFKIVSNGTDNHLMLVDLRCIGMTGKQARQWCVNITANKNTVPLIRSHHHLWLAAWLLSPAMTTREGLC